MPYADILTRRAYMRNWKRQNREHVNATERSRRARNPAAFRATKLRHRYGLSHEDYQRIYDEQNGICALCNERAAVDVDHDHAVGKVRGLLCRACNLGLGMFRDDPKLIGRALTYLGWHWNPPSLGSLGGTGG